jgi:chorismate mutase
VEQNTPEDILSGTREVLQALIAANGIGVEDVASVFLSASPDLTAEFPALAVRELGWLETAVLCTHEMQVPHGLERCVRVLLHWNTERTLGEIEHVYLKSAVKLRPDRAPKGK